MWNKSLIKQIWKCFVVVVFTDPWGETTASHKYSEWYVHKTNLNRNTPSPLTEVFRSSLTLFPSFFCFFFTGSLSVLKPLDREEQEVFNLTIVAEDHGIPQLSTSQVLCVQVIDVNDEAPVFQSSEFQTQVLENQGPGTTVLTVTATDRDQGSILIFFSYWGCQWWIYCPRKSPSSSLFMAI